MAGRRVQRPRGGETAELSGPAGGKAAGAAAPGTRGLPFTGAVTRAGEFLGHWRVTPFVSVAHQLHFKPLNGRDLARSSSYPQHLPLPSRVLSRHLCKVIKRTGKSSRPGSGPALAFTASLRGHGQVMPVTPGFCWANGDRGGDFRDEGAEVRRTGRTRLTANTHLATESGLETVLSANSRAVST